MLDSPPVVGRMTLLAGLALLLAGMACSPDSHEGPGESRPSILFVVIDTLREEMRRFIETSRFDQGYPQDPGHALTPQVIEALRSLGYIEA